MDKSRIIDKIYKCLRLSESCNANEAAAAVRQAQRLMGKYGISESEIISAHIGESSAQLAHAEVAFWCVALAELVAEAFACRAYLVKRQRTAAQWRFIGPGCSAQVSAYTFCVLQRRLIHARDTFLAGLASITTAEERQRQGEVFAQAWLLRISRTVSRFVADTRVEAAIERYTAEHYGDVGEWQQAAPRAGQQDYETIVRGMRDAERVRLFRPVSGETAAVASLQSCDG